MLIHIDFFIYSHLRAFGPSALVPAPKVHYRYYVQILAKKIELSGNLKAQKEKVSGSHSNINYLYVGNGRETAHKIFHLKRKGKNQESIL